ncbi:glycosyl hydrolase catalytic core-domain-containing protein [Lasiosphaeria miniovina]|uniref:Glycosyl hydrolase catalytic core-domain-containing protein n=1 Tax=Lasiosphaeria miniovina TaxID=1954250 RepID=A0AA40A031_9PEZI|nr:glycosyl hydrolase catalytic core-domain-containing protein [Lasiosphaeria miniovina]KAK0706831.1 glycosyl hydrolase catalytic core-domain-containing protein [Lasiosphaeria miniovina]
MFSNAILALAAASLAGHAVALGPRQHVHQHLHNNKRALVTELVTVTDWVTVTVGDKSTTSSAREFLAQTRQVRSSSSSSSSSVVAPPSPPVVAPTPTTIITQVKSSAASSVAPVAKQPEAAAAAPSPSTPAPAASRAAQAPPAVVKPAATSAAAATPAATPAAAPASGGLQRGLVYNDHTLLPRFLTSGTKATWTYNWGQGDDSGVGLEFVPMLWSTSKGFPATWPANAAKAISAGSKCVLSFNEPDLPSQADLSPADAAAAHIQLMNPLSGKVRIGSPAITNSQEAGQGIKWLTAFLTACNGQCKIDFTAIHIYGVPPDVFLAHILEAHAAAKTNIWITEFGFPGSPDDVNKSLQTVLKQLETNATFSFVERASFFMVSDGLLAQGGGVSTLGQTFAFGA